MAAYPSIIQVFGTKSVDIGGFSHGRTVSGVLKIRSYFTDDVRQFEVLHDVDDTDKATHEAFYVANRKLVFDFTFAADVQVYTCRFLQTPLYTPTPGGRWSIKVSIEVV